MESLEEGLFHHPLDHPLKSSPRDFEAFIKDSPLWKDIEQTIRDRIEILTEDLISCEDEKMMYRLQTEIRVWKEAIAVPHYLLEHAKIEHSIKEKSNAQDKE